MKNLNRYGIDTHNVHSAIRSCRESEHDPDTYRDIIRDALDLGEFASVNVEDDMAEFAARAAIQLAFESPEGATVELAIEKANALLAKYPSARKPALVVTEEAPATTEGEEEVKTNSTPKKGYKKKRAIELWNANQGKITERKEWIELFMAEIADMSKAVANTYVHNLTTGKW